MEENIEEIQEIEEPVKEKKTFKDKLKEPKYKIMLVVLLLCGIVGAGYYIYSSLNWTAEKIVRTLVEDKANLSLVVFEDQKNPNVAYFKDNIIKVEDLDYTGMIEVFENKTEALLKRDYYVLFDTEMEKEFNVETLGAELAKKYGTGKHTVYVNGNTLIRLSYHYSEYQANQLIKQFDAVMEKTYQSEKNIPTEEQQKNIKKNYEKDIDKQIKEQHNLLIQELKEDLDALNKEIENAEMDRLLEIKNEAESYKQFADLALDAVAVQDAVDAKIQTQIDVIDNMLDEAEAEYSRTKIQSTKDAIQLLTHTYFETYKVDWNTRIDKILHKIKEKEIQDYKDKCTNYSKDHSTYASIDDSYKGKFAYFKGKIDGVSTNSSGRITFVVNVTPKYILGNIAYWTDPVYVDVDNGVSSYYSQGDIIEMWGTIEGMLVNEQVFGDAKSYPTFYCKYAD